jgi:hypothetical protein
MHKPPRSGPATAIISTYDAILLARHQASRRVITPHIELAKIAGNDRYPFFGARPQVKAILASSGRGQPAILR